MTLKRSPGARMAELAGLAEAVAELVHDGDSVALEGFTHLIPMAAGHEVLRQGRRELELVRMTPDILYWIGPGRVRVAFLGAAQVNRHANLNSTVIGDSEHPRTQLPGAGGAPEIATGPQEMAVTEAPTREELAAR
jgi:acyl CoA:acetate/3-ketoacid CoA transferase beta subunit